jgi:hypothetical protein
MAHNPLAELILNSLAARGWRKSQLMTAVGYSNVNRGLRRLEAVFAGDLSNVEFLQRVREAMDVPPAVWEAALNATLEEQARQQAVNALLAEAVAREHFQPYIHVRTSRSRPTSITIAVLWPALRRVPLEETILALPERQRARRVGALVAAHYREHDGELPLFGDITGYAFRLAFDRTAVYDVEGELLEVRDGWQESEGGGSIRVGGQALAAPLWRAAE